MVKSTSPKQNTPPPPLFFFVQTRPECTGRTEREIRVLTHLVEEEEQELKLLLLYSRVHLGSWQPRSKDSRSLFFFFKKKKKKICTLYTFLCFATMLYYSIRGPVEQLPPGLDGIVPNLPKPRLSDNFVSKYYGPSKSRLRGPRRHPLEMPWQQQRLEHHGL